MERLADENKEKGKECFSSDRLISRKRTVDDHENLDLELRLGPPLNGNSGVEYSKKPKILNCANSDDENSNENGINEFQFSLISPSSSLPLETEEEGEEREELQSRKHLEEMRKRWEKMKNIIRVDQKNDQNGSGSSGGPVFETSQQSLNQGASVGRLGSGLSMVLVQKLIGAAIERSNNEKLSPVLLSSSYNIAKARWMLLRNFMLIKMPRVWTRGDGPNGEKTHGFLYSCRNIEDVKIVCVCHGYVLSPAEFVKHAGGGDVENPLRHIVVNTLPMW